MLLGFKTQHAGKPTNFPAKILLCPEVKQVQQADGSWPYASETFELWKGAAYLHKLHTLRADEQCRWHAGRQIDFATGIRTKQFQKFATATCTGVQPVYINGLYYPNPVAHKPPKLYDFEIRVGEAMRLLRADEARTFALNDGFESWKEFMTWFTPPVIAAPSGLLSLRLIHWTPLRY